MTEIEQYEHTRRSSRYSGSRLHTKETHCIVRSKKSNVFYKIGSGHKKSKRKVHGVRCHCVADKHTESYWRQKQKNRSKYRKVDVDKMDDKKRPYYHIQSTMEYKQKMLHLIDGYFKPYSLSDDLKKLMIDFYWNSNLQNVCYFIYECKEKKTYQFRYRHDYKIWKHEFERMSYIEGIDIESNEYLIYHPTFSNGKDLKLRHFNYIAHRFGEMNNSYIRHNNIIYKIGKGQQTHYKHQCVAYNLYNGEIRKLPQLNPIRYDVGLCYSEKYGLICIGGESVYGKRCDSYWYNQYDIMQTLDLSQKKLEWQFLGEMREGRAGAKCLMLTKDTDKMFICGGGGHWEDFIHHSKWGSKRCQIYDFETKELNTKLKEMHYRQHRTDAIEWKYRNNEIVTPREYYDFNKNEWYLLPEPIHYANTMYMDYHWFPIKLMETERIDNFENVLVLIGMDDENCKYNHDLRWKEKEILRRDEDEVIILMYDYRDNAKKWKKIGSIKLGNEMLRAIV